MEKVQTMRPTGAGHGIADPLIRRHKGDTLPWSVQLPRPRIGVADGGAAQIGGARGFENPSVSTPDEQHLESCRSYTQVIVLELFLVPT